MRSEVHEHMEENWGLSWCLDLLSEHLVSAEHFTGLLRGNRIESLKVKGFLQKHFQ